MFKTKIYSEVLVLYQTYIHEIFDGASAEVALIFLIELGDS